MIFTSYTYALFLVTALVVHWLLPVTWRKQFLIFASYVFYATWRWELAFLLLGLSLFNWAWAKAVLSRAPGRALWVGIAVNVGVLVYFKYANFFLQNISALGHAAGLNWTPSLLNIVLPLGLSFFTFQGIA